MHSYIANICLTFLHCASLNVFSNCLPEKMQIHIGCIYFTFLHCAFSNVSPCYLPEKRHSHIGCICLTPLCTFKCVLKWPVKEALVAFIQFDDLVSLFLQDFYICARFQQKFHCHCVLCFGQMVASNWVKSFRQ